jgi:hypothetical protein
MFENDTYETISCRECGKQCKQITNGHLFFTHGYKLTEYKVKYPNAPLVSQKWKDNKRETSKAYCKANPDKVKERNLQNKELWKTEEFSLKMKASFALRPAQTNETKQQISKTMKAHYQNTPTFPRRVKNENESGKDNHFYGKKHTEESKKLQREHTAWHYLGMYQEPSKFEKKIISWINIIKLPFKIDFNYPEPDNNGKCHRGYCIDFAILEFKIAIEIDSDICHSSPEKIESDNRKDLFLQSLGWHVIRIPFNYRKDSPQAVLNKFQIEIKKILKNYENNIYCEAKIRKYPYRLICRKEP